MKTKFFRIAVLLACACALCASPRAADPNINVTFPSPKKTPRPVVALVTDFGMANEAVGECHGAILAVDREIAIVDLSNNIKPFDIAEGARVLAKPVRFPPGTVFVGVIDPGVGTKRRPIALRTHIGMYYVAPDNGLLGEVAASQGIEAAVELDPAKINPLWKAGTFDGRDLFSPAGALLAASGGDLDKLGKAIDPKTLVKLKPAAAVVDKAKGTITAIYDRTDEPYGNIWTNVTPEDLKAAGIRLGDNLSVRIEGATRVMPWATAFGDVPQGKPLAYLNSENRLAFAINLGDCRADWGAPEKSKITISPAPKQD